MCKWTASEWLQKTSTTEALATEKPKSSKRFRESRSPQ